ncbi:hypothetical protein [Nonomuraea sp. NPDC003214]
MGNVIATDAGVDLKDFTARVEHDNVRAATIYQYAARGADKLITEASEHAIGYRKSEGSFTTPPTLVADRRTS